MGIRVDILQLGIKNAMEKLEISVILAIILVIINSIGYYLWYIVKITHHQIKVTFSQIISSQAFSK